MAIDAECKKIRDDYLLIVSLSLKTIFRCFKWKTIVDCSNIRVSRKKVIEERKIKRGGERNNRQRIKEVKKEAEKVR